MTKHAQECFMSEAIKVARDNMRANRGGPFGAVIVKDGKIISRGGNEVTSLNDPTAHAEIVAIRRACQALNTFVLNGCDIYTSCEPCPMCLCAIYWARIDHIYYAGNREDAKRAGFDDEIFYKELQKDYKDRLIPISNCGREEIVGVFDEWIKKEDKTPY